MTVIRMNLPAFPPNEGARTIARCILERDSGDLTTAAARSQIRVTMIDRLVTGEVVPGEELMRDIAVLTCGTATRRDFQQPARSWWFDPAIEAAALQRAA